MPTRLVVHGWDREIEDALALRATPIVIVTPFIKTEAVQRFVAAISTGCRVITRFNLNDVAAGVSDLQALELLHEAGAAIRGVRDLHAKLYLFGTRRAIVTSANLTEAALTRNHELGFVTDDADSLAGCNAYVEQLWNQCGPDVGLEQLRQWSQRVSEHAPALTRAHAALGDFGARVALGEPNEQTRVVAAVARANTPPPATPRDGTVIDPHVPDYRSLNRLRAAREGRIGFYGGVRAAETPATPIAAVVARTRASWGFDFGSPPPLRLRTGSPFFFAQYVTTDEGAFDVMIFGRGRALRDDPDRPELGFRQRNYVRIEQPEFLEGQLSDGVSLKLLIETIGERWFDRTRGDPDHRTVYRNRKHIPITVATLAWLNQQLDERLQRDEP